MGEIRANVTLENTADRNVFDRGHGLESDIRRTTVDGLVDTGAVSLVLPEDIVERLGLGQQGTAVVTYADERQDERPLAGPVTVQIGNRAMITNCIAGPGQSEPLIGQVVLEDARPDRRLREPHAGAPASRLPGPKGQSREDRRTWKERRQRTRSDRRRPRTRRPSRGRRSNQGEPTATRVDGGARRRRSLQGARGRTIDAGQRIRVRRADRRMAGRTRKTARSEPLTAHTGAEVKEVASPARRRSAHARRRSHPVGQLAPPARGMRRRYRASETAVDYRPRARDDEPALTSLAGEANKRSPRTRG